jgi:SAM-dependent methyltransferase
MPSLLQAALSVLRAPATEFAFALRSRLRWSRGRVVLANEDKGELFAFLPPAERAAAERRAQHWRRWPELQRLAGRSSRTTWLDALARLDGLERLVGAHALPVGDDGVLRALDVGCGDFRYATALAAFFARHGRRSGEAPRRVVLRGVELDGHGIYRDGHARADHAAAHAELATEGGGDVQFQVADFTRRRWPEQDVVTMFFPFLSAHACLQWGVPLSRLRPRRLLARAVAAVRPGGWLLVVDQTPAEHRRLCELLAGHPVQLLATASFASALVPWAERTEGQVATLWRRQADVPLRQSLR